MRLIVCDIDGTLMKSNEKVPDKSVVKMIDDITADNCLFGFATGRSYVEVKKLFEKSTDCLSICCDGALAMYKEQVVFEKCFDKEVLKTFDSYDSVVLYGKYMIYAKGNAGFLRKIKKQFSSHVTAFDSVSEIDADVYKVVVYGNNLRTLHIEGFKKIYSSYSIAEFIPGDVDKYSTTAHIIEKNDISPDECAVFGDGDNDVTMLGGFKNSYAAAWSKPSVKASANNIFDNIVNKIYEIQNI